MCIYLHSYRKNECLELVLTINGINKLKQPINIIIMKQLATNKISISPNTLIYVKQRQILCGINEVATIYPLNLILNWQCCHLLTSGGNKHTIKQYLSEIYLYNFAFWLWIINEKFNCKMNCNKSSMFDLIMNLDLNQFPSDEFTTHFIFFWLDWGK